MTITLNTNNFNFDLSFIFYKNYFPITSIKIIFKIMIKLIILNVNLKLKLIFKLFIYYYSLNLLNIIETRMIKYIVIIVYELNIHEMFFELR
jgi:hypothetical protein